MADLSRSMPTVARLYTQGRYRRASVKPGPGRALVLREDAEREAREAYAAGVHAGRAERDHLHTEYPADIGYADKRVGAIVKSCGRPAAHHVNQRSKRNVVLPKDSYCLAHCRPCLGKSALGELGKTLNIGIIVVHLLKHVSEPFRHAVMSFYCNFNTRQSIDHFERYIRPVLRPTSELRYVLLSVDNQDLPNALRVSQLQKFHAVARAREAASDFLKWTQDAHRKYFLGGLLPRGDVILATFVRSPSEPDGSNDCQKRAYTTYPSRNVSNFQPPNRRTACHA